MTTAQGGAAVVLRLGEQPMDCDLHPLEPIVATSLIDGRLIATRFDIAAGTFVPKIKLKAHGESSRAVAFSPDAQLLLTASADGSILAVDCGTGVACARLSSAHACGINRLAFTSESVLASGDDDGAIKLWDTRTREPCGAFQAHTDYVSDITLSDGGASLLVTSGDGTLSINDLRTLKVSARSEEDAEEEFCCCAVVRGGRKIVCGTSGGGSGGGNKSGGVLNIFSNGYWNGPSDRMTGHPSSVDCMVAVDGTTVATGCSDGFIRLVQIQPNKMLSTLGMHGTASGKRQEGSPVEAIVFSQKQQVLASAGHDDTVRLWSLREEEDPPADAAADDFCPDASAAAPAASQATATADDSDSDSDQPRKKKSKTAKKGAHKIQKGAAAAASKAAFFADL